MKEIVMRNYMDQLSYIKKEVENGAHNRTKKSKQLLSKTKEGPSKEPFLLLDRQESSNRELSCGGVVIHSPSCTPVDLEAARRRAVREAGNIEDFALNKKLRALHKEHMLWLKGYKRVLKETKEKLYKDIDEQRVLFYLEDIK